MTGSRGNRFDLFQQILSSRREKGVGKIIPDIIDGLLVGMHHVFGVKPVVAQVVKQQFVCRKIMYKIKPLTQFRTSQHQYGLTALIFHKSIAQMAHRTHA